MLEFYLGMLLLLREANEILDDARQEGFAAPSFSNFPLIADTQNALAYRDDKIILIM